MRGKANETSMLFSRKKIRPVSISNLTNNSNVTFAKNESLFRLKSDFQSGRGVYWFLFIFWTICLVSLISPVLDWARCNKKGMEIS